MKKITSVGLDLAKAVFQVHGADEGGRTVLMKRLSRSQVVNFFAKLPPCLVGMEACASAHHWARQLAALGHSVRLMAPQYVKAYVKTNKTDAADAEAICEAVRRPNMRFVPVKTREQQAILTVHRVRESYVKARTAQANQIRGLLGEYGMVLPQGVKQLARVRELLDQTEDLPEVFKQMIGMQLDHLKELEARILEAERQIQQWQREDEASKRLMAIPGVGILTATAISASVGDARQFTSSRQMAAWLGLVPRQHSSGGKARLQGISKRGDVYLRKLLIHGARAVLHPAQAKPEAEHTWLVQVMRRRNKNVAAVALAHKNARIMWALLSRKEIFDPACGMAAA
jgi:transposase